nr:hypothetical protein [Actinoplanes regularis]
MPDFTRWPSFPFEGDMRVKKLAPPVEVEPPRSGEDGSECVACGTSDDAYIWVSERWRVRAMDRPTGLPMVLILECRSHLDLGDLPNLLAAELGVMTVRLERAIRSLDGVARVHVNRWGDGSAHLHMWFLARPYGRLQLRGTFLSLWDDILPVIPEPRWRENLALVAAWLADFGGTAIAEPAHIEWESSGTLNVPATGAEEERRPATLDDVQTAGGPTDSWARHDDAPAAGGVPGQPNSARGLVTQAGPADIEEIVPASETSELGVAASRDTSLGTARNAAGSAPGGSAPGGFGAAGAAAAGFGTAGPEARRSGAARSEAAGFGSAGSGIAGSGTAGPGTAGPGTAGAGTAGAGTAGAGTAASGFVGTGVLSTGAGGAAAGAGNIEP